MSDFPFLGFGLGLRPRHYPHILETWPDQVDWFEVISENYMGDGGRPLHVLDQVAARYPVVMHGVSLSIGSTDPLNRDYLKRLKQLAERVKPVWISDHLCWSSTGKHTVHDLLPLPYTQETIDHVVARVKQVQDFLGRQILLENVSSYMAFSQSTMPEWEFLAAIVDGADCMTLLDVNNIYVSAFNHRFDPETYLNAIPVGRVGQFHLAGHTDNRTHLLDTHDHPVCAAVWDLYVKAVNRFGRISTMIERDDHIPPFDELMQELSEAKRLFKETYGHYTVAHPQKNSGAAVAAHHGA